jgi:hypothetical protein
MLSFQKRQIPGDALDVIQNVDQIWRNIPNRLRHHLGSFETPKTTAIYLGSIWFCCLGTDSSFYSFIPRMTRQKGDLSAKIRHQKPAGLKPLVKTCWTSIEQCPKFFETTCWFRELGHVRTLWSL